METEAATKKLINIPNVEKYIFCPKDITDCPHLDRSIIVYENKVGRCSCSNLEAVNIDIPRIDTIQICPLFKLSNEDR